MINKRFKKTTKNGNMNGNTNDINDKKQQNGNKRQKRLKK